MRIHIALVLLLSLWLTYVSAFDCAKDGYCDAETESCFWCEDCSCSFDGLRVRIWKDKAKNVDTTSLSSLFEVFSSSKIVFPPNFVDKSGPLFIVMDGYLQVNVTQHYTFRFTSANVGVTFKINGHKVVDYPPQAEVKSTVRVVLQREYIHRLSVEVQSFSYLNKSLTLDWKLNDNSDYKEFTESFYSYNVCGDHIFDKLVETSCTDDDKLNKTFNGESDQCGDGLCLERFPETCFMDCYTEITKICSPIAVPPGHISAGLPVRDDTFGSLIRNQMLWHLPGIEHMSYGFDIVKGEQSLYPLFYFGYCDEKSFSTVQDTYRGNVYTVPQELYAQPLPKCTFSVESKSYSSAAKLANRMEQEVSIDASLSANVNVGLYSGSGSLAFSGSRAVKAASELETKSSGSVVKSEIQCATSQVKLAKYNFHPTFLEAVAKSKNMTDIQNLLKNYGTYVYSSVILGGKLQQITTMSKSFQSSKTTQELEEHASLSLSASVSGPSFSGSGSFSGSVDSTTKGESQKSYEESSFRSTVITSGGPPGSFGPTTSDAPSNFGDWASSVDLLPVPISFTLIPIYDVIPQSWSIKFESGSSVNVREAFIDAQTTEFTSESAQSQRLSEAPKPIKYSMYWFWDDHLKHRTFDVDDYFQLAVTNNDSTIWSRKILDQQLGRAGIWNFNTTAQPLRFDFYFSVSFLELNNISISSNRGVLVDQHNGHWYPNGEGFGQVYLHNWNTGRGWWADNRDYYLSDSIPNHFWNIHNSTGFVYEIYLDITWAGGNSLGEGVFEVTFVGADEKLLDTVTWKNVMVRPEEGTKAIKMKWDSRPKIGLIQKVRIRLSALTYTDKDHEATYNIKNIWLQIPSCDANTLDLSCDPTGVGYPAWRVVHSNPGKEFTLSSYDTSLVEVPLRSLQYYDV